MGRPATLLEGLSGHALALAATSIKVEYQNSDAWVFAIREGAAIKIARYPVSGADGKELRQNLMAARKKPVRTILNGRACVLKIRALEGFGESGMEVLIEPVAKPDPSTPPSFTKKQGQYLAFLYHYTKIHRQPPSEADLERYFRVSPPSVHEMIKTLQRNGLIEKVPGQARSIRVLVAPEHLPRLE